MSYPRPVIAAMAVMVGIKTLLAAAAVTELIGPVVTGVILAVILAVEVGVAFYVQGQVVPLAKTVVYESQDERMRAGGASELRTGAVVYPGDSMEVLVDPHSPRADHGPIS
jgi:hypothetical protein